MPTIKREPLTEARARALWAWPTNEAYTIADTKMPGLLLRKGKKRTAWHFYHDRSLHGQRIVTSKVLGSMPNMTLADARRAAKKQIGRIAADRPEPGKRSAVKFSDALDEYMIHLRDRAAKAGKEASWAKRVDGLAKLYLRPKWGKWALATMSDNPAAVRDWHRDLAARAPVSANHAARVVRAVYRHAGRLNRSLPPGLPTSAVRFAKEVPRQAGLPFDQWPKWGIAWAKIGSSTRRAFAMLGILTGMRPGELSRLRWQDVKPRSRSITIRAAKAGHDVVIPMSAAIARALRTARDAPGDRNGYVFPARAGGHLAQFAGDGLPAHGHALRHCYRDAALAAGVDEFVTRMLMGHSLRGISQEYVTKAVISSGPSLRAAQRTISAKIMGLLNMKEPGKWPRLR
jgi:integrase